MVTSDDDKSNETRRPRARSGTENQSAGGSAPQPSDRDLQKELQDAYYGYHRAMQQACDLAAQNTWKAGTNLVVAQQRVVQETGNQLAAAYGDWLRKLQEAVGQTDPSAHLRQAQQMYRQAVDSSIRSGRDNWDQSREQYQSALSEIQESYANAVTDALKTYLAQIKTTWSEVDLDRVDARTLLTLARAVGYAAYTAQMILRD
jgi:hypothetical protein